jgi:choice-of-anchor B domain-containing protein
MRNAPLFAAGLAAACAVGAANADEDVRKFLGHIGVVEGPIVYGPLPEGPFEASGATLLSQVPLNQFPGGHNSGNDCWGYVSPSGREYALMGLQRGFGVVEVTDPSNPVIVGSISGPSSTWHDIKVIGEYAYGVSEGGSGIQVIDLRDVDNGNVTLVQNKTQAGHTSTHNIVSNPDSGYLYLCGANIQNGGLIAVSTANPADPTIAGSWNSFYVHDAVVTTYTSGPFAGREIAFCCSGTGNGSGSTGMRVVDVTDKNNMTQISDEFWSSARYSHQAWLSEDKQYLYLGDELDEGNTVSTTRTMVFDVSDPANPTLVNEFTNGQAAIDHNMYVRDGLLFQANYTSGLRVYDIASNPTSPQEVAYFDTHPESNGASFNGAWSCYPLLPSGTVIISDTSRGMFAVRVGGLSFAFANTPTQLSPTSETPIEVEVSAFLAQLDPGSVVLRTRIDGGAPVDTPMTLVSGSTFEGLLPSAPCFSEVTYSVVAESTAGDEFESETYDATVFTNRNEIFHDNFETNTGWSPVNLGASSGDWQRGVPVNDPGWEYDPESDSDGSGQCFVTQNQSGNTDVDDGAVELTSPAFDLSDPNATLSYDYFLNMTNQGGTDFLTVEGSDNGGSSWRPLVAHDTSGGLSWRTQTFTAGQIQSAGLSLTANFKLRFTANDANPQSIVEAGVDAFLVESLACEAGCYPDCDGNTTLDVFDFLCFQDAFVAMDPYADCDGSTTLDVFDFLCFQDAFVTGCP